MSYLINRNVAATALNEAQIEFDANYKGLGEAKKIIDSLPTVNAVIVPDNATNGEVIKALFPYLIINECEAFREKEILTSYEWWDTPYKKGEQE